MGREFNEEKYFSVLVSCELLNDLQEMIEGDQTNVGDNGKLLSEGQKSRICLARVVYSDFDIYLLDDPFASLDSKVAKSIMEKCVNGLLSKKTRIVVLNDIESLKYFDRIIIIDHGSIEFNGDFNSLNFDALPLNLMQYSPQKNRKKQVLKQKFQANDKSRRRGSLLSSTELASFMKKDASGFGFKTLYNFLIFGFRSILFLLVFLVGCSAVQFFYVISQY